MWKRRDETKAHSLKSLGTENGVSQSLLPFPFAMILRRLCLVFAKMSSYHLRRVLAPKAVMLTEEIWSFLRRTSCQSTSIPTVNLSTILSADLQDIWISVPECRWEIRNEYWDGQSSRRGVRLAMTRCRSQSCVICVLRCTEGFFCTFVVPFCFENDRAKNRLPVLRRLILRTGHVVLWIV